ncbi:MAG: sulfite exporter TauE/SafE family protein [Candidatus Zixiibacteriota bacterium]
MEWYMYLAVIGAGFAAGFINTLAGSGSLITLPLLIFLGLPANAANGTNRIAILLQNIVGVRTFHNSHLLNIRHGLRLAIPAIIGAIIGAQIASDLNERLMHHTIGVIMVCMLIILLLRPKRWFKAKTLDDITKTSFVQMLIFFGIGIYGGFIQAGVGIFLLAGLMLSVGFDELHANPVKVLIILCFTFFAVIVFAINDQIVWTVGLIMAVGNMLGAWVAVKVAIKKGNGFIRWILIVVVAVSAAKLLGVIDLIF